jgi:hypothetical protein
MQSRTDNCKTAIQLNDEVEVSLFVQRLYRLDELSNDGVLEDKSLAARRLKAAFYPDPKGLRGKFG